MIHVTRARKHKHTHTHTPANILTRCWYHRHERHATTTAAGPWQQAGRHRSTPEYHQRVRAPRLLLLSSTTNIHSATQLRWWLLLLTNNPHAHCKQPPEKGAGALHHRKTSRDVDGRRFSGSSGLCWYGDAPRGSGGCCSCCWGVFRVMRLREFECTVPRRVVLRPSASAAWGAHKSGCGGCGGGGGARQCRGGGHGRWWRCQRCEPWCGARCGIGRRWWHGGSRRDARCRARWAGGDADSVKAAERAAGVHTLRATCRKIGDSNRKRYDFQTAG